MCGKPTLNSFEDFIVDLRVSAHHELSVANNQVRPIILLKWFYSSDDQIGSEATNNIAQVKGLITLETPMSEKKKTMWKLQVICYAMKVILCDVHYRSKVWTHLLMHFSFFILTYNSC